MTPAVVSSISPTSVTAGGAGFTLTVNGSNFASNADVVWGNPDNPEFSGGAATFVSASKLTLQISAANIAIPGTVQVSVLNPLAPVSNVVALSVNPSSAGGAQVISTSANGGTPNGNSHEPVLSYNGRFVAFASEATNLVSPNTTFAQAYVRDTCLGADRCTPATLLASAVTGGTTASPVEGNSLGGASPLIGDGFPSAGRDIGFLSCRNQSDYAKHNFSAGVCQRHLLCVCHFSPVYAFYSPRFGDAGWR